MNQGYIITNNDTKVLVATDNTYGKKVVDYNSHIKEILTNENLIETLDKRIESCDNTGELLYNIYQKYLKFEKTCKTVLLSSVVLFILSPIFKMALNIDNMFIINVILIGGITTGILSIPVVRLLKKQMHAEIERNAFKMELLDKERTKLLEKNKQLAESAAKERVEERDNTIFEINHKKELEMLNEEIQNKLNLAYASTQNQPKRKIRTR